MKQATVEITETKVLSITLDMDIIAQWFCALDDEAQADFFIKVTEIAKGWPSYQDKQWFDVGRHLRDCSCSTNEARSMIQTLAAGLEP